MTTDSKHNKPIYSNHLDRQFNAEIPNQRWVSDITYIPTHEGGFILQWSWIYIPVKLLAGPFPIE